MIGTGRIESRGDVSISPGANHIEEPRTEFRRVLEMLENLLANHEIALFRIALANVEIDSLEPSRQAETAQHPLGVVQRELADIEANAACPRDLLQCQLRIHPTADSDLIEHLHVAKTRQQQVLEPFCHVIVLRPNIMGDKHTRQISPRHVLFIVVHVTSDICVVRCFVATVPLEKDLVPHGVVAKLRIAIQHLVQRLR